MIVEPHYNDDGLLIGPLRFERATYKYRGTQIVWVPCWNDPGVRERIHEECRAITDMEKPRHDR